jgi:hypothetical protein
MDSYRQVSSPTTFPKSGDSSKYKCSERLISSKVSKGDIYDKGDEFMGGKDQKTSYPK